MYTGNNPKALLSIELIIKGFMEEIHKKPYEDINIKSICKKADVSRQTFYNVFDNKEEVLRKCIKQIFQEILVCYTETEKITARQSIIFFVKTFYKNQDFIEILIKNNLENILTEELVYAFTNLLQQEKYKEGSYIDYQLEFYAGGLTRFLIHWMKDENRVSANMLIDILENSIMLPFF